MSDVNIRPLIPKGPVFGLEQSFESDQFRSFVYTHPNSENINWWQAVRDPAWNPKTQTATGNAGWLRTYQSLPSPYRAVIQGARMARKYFPQGEVQTSDLTVTTMPDELPIGDHDWIIPMGKDGPQNARTWRYSENLIRGETLVNLAGTVTSASLNQITGVGTTFTTDFHAGDILISGQQSFIVQSVITDTLLTLDRTSDPPLNKNAYQKGIETVLFWPAANIIQLITTQKAYTEFVDFELAPPNYTTNTQQIQWLNGNAPVAGTIYSILYTYYQRYECVGDMGIHRQGVGGQVLLQTVVCRLWKETKYQNA
jgi:hypothetical protein